MLQATHPPQPPTNRAEDRQAVDRSQSAINPTHNAQRTSIQPLWGSLYAVGVKRRPRNAKPELGMNINQFDEYRNRFFDVIERVRFLDADGVLVNRIILDVRGLIVQIVAHDDSPRTVIMMIGEHVRMIRRDALIFIFLHLAKRSQA